MSEEYRCKHPHPTIPARACNTFFFEGELRDGNLRVPCRRCGHETVITAHTDSDAATILDKHVLVAVG